MPAVYVDIVKPAVAKIFEPKFKDNAVKAMPSAKASLTIKGADKVEARDVEDLAEALVEAAMKAATKFMASTTPE